MRRSTAATAAVAATLGLLGPGLAGCSTQLTDRAPSVRSSAAAVAAKVPGRQLCLDTRDDLRTLDSLAGRLVNNPGLASRLAPQVSAAYNRLTAEVHGRSEWRDVLAAVGNLGTSLKEADGATVRLTARQVQLAVKVTQAGCSYAH